MKCSKCGTDIDARKLFTSQGDVLECPFCHAKTTVVYTIKDEINDPVGAFIFRDLKYARSPLKFMALLLGVPLILLVVVFGFLAGGDLPELRLILLATACMLVAYGVRAFMKNGRS